MKKINIDRLRAEVWLDPPGVWIHLWRKGRTEEQLLEAARKAVSRVAARCAERDAWLKKEGYIPDCKGGYTHQINIGSNADEHDGIRDGGSDAWIIDRTETCESVNRRFRIGIDFDEIIPIHKALFRATDEGRELLIIVDYLNREAGFAEPGDDPMSRQNVSEDYLLRNMGISAWPCQVEDFSQAVGKDGCPLIDGTVELLAEIKEGCE